MSDHDRTVNVVQKWAHMGTTKPHSLDELAGLWSASEAMAFYPDACQILTGKIQKEFTNRPGLAKGDLDIHDFNAPQNPVGKVKTVDDLAKLVLASPSQ